MKLRFKSVILINMSESRCKEINEIFNGSVIKVFNTSSMDEVQQIVDMSDKTAILTDDVSMLNRFMSATISREKGLFRKYFVDWEKRLARQEMSKLSAFDVSTIKPEKLKEIITKVELYLTGRISLNGNGSSSNQHFDTLSLSKGYFTHLRKEDGRWITFISSHEQDESIDKVLGEEWDDYIERIIGVMEKNKKMSQFRVPDKPLFEIIFPHMIEDKVDKISIVHLKSFDPKDEVIDAVKNFLRKIA